MKKFTMTKILEENIQEERNRLLNHIFFKELLKGNFSKKSIRIFAEQYYLLSDSFCTMMFFACANIRSEETRLPILVNLWDEHGQGNLKLSHRTLLKKFIFSIDSNIQLNEIKPLKSTTEYINNMINFYKKSLPLESLSALGSGCESLTVQQYKNIYIGLKNRYNFTDDELIFFIEHIHHDPKHSYDIDIVLEKLLNKDNLQNAIESSKKAINEEIKFWNGLYNVCKKT